MVRLEWAFRRYADIVGLLGGQFGEAEAQLGEVQASHLLVQVLGQGVDLVLVLALILVKGDLGQPAGESTGTSH